MFTLFFSGSEFNFFFKFALISNCLEVIIFGWYMNKSFKTVMSIAMWFDAFHFFFNLESSIFLSLNQHYSVVHCTVGFYSLLLKNEPQSNKKTHRKKKTTKNSKILIPKNKKCVRNYPPPQKNVTFLPLWPLRSPRRC